jgi:hypothetical protein
MPGGRIRFSRLVTPKTENHLPTERAIRFWLAVFERPSF